MYIHRVGRTARYNAGGRALLFLMNSEEQPVLKELQNVIVLMKYPSLSPRLLTFLDLSQAGVPITKLTVNKKFKISVASRAAALIASKPEYRL